MNNQKTININGYDIEPNELSKINNNFFLDQEQILKDFYLLRSGLNVKYVNVFKWLASCGKVCTNIAGGQNSRDKRTKWTEEVLDKNNMIHGFVLEKSFNSHGYKVMKNTFDKDMLIQNFNMKNEDPIYSNEVKDIYHLQDRFYGLKFFWLSTNKGLIFKGLYKQIDIKNFYDRSYYSQWKRISKEYNLLTGEIKTSVNNCLLT